MPAVRTLARATATIAQIAAIATATAMNLRISATYPVCKDSCRLSQSPRPHQLYANLPDFRASRTPGCWSR